MVFTCELDLHVVSVNLRAKYNRWNVILFQAVSTRREPDTTPLTPRREVLSPPYH